MKNIAFFSGDITNSGGTERVSTIIASELSKKSEYNIIFISITEKRSIPFFEINEKIKKCQSVIDFPINDWYNRQCQKK